MADSEMIGDAIWISRTDGDGHVWYRAILLPVGMPIGTDGHDKAKRDYEEAKGDDRAEVL